MRKHSQKSCKRNKAIKGGGLLNSLINKLPFEAHIPGYQYCGPGTKLKKRLQRGDPGINKLDKACKIHDIAYTNYSDLDKRHEADKLLASEAIKRLKSSDAGFGEKAAALGVVGAMKTKMKLGMGVKKKRTQIKGITFNNAIKKARAAIKQFKSKDIVSASKIALKAVRGIKKRKPTRVIPIPKTGGFLPLIPIFAGLSALGALSGGAAGIAKAVNAAKAASKQLEEAKLHNRTMETIAMGKGLYLKPFKKGYGVYLSKN